MPDGNSLPMLRRAAIGARLASGADVSDDEVDAALPGWARALSTLHWTPVRVAQRAARFLVDGRPAHVLDVGSGVGKFCAVGAATTGARFTGVERRPALVEAATRLAKALDVSDAHFVCGAMEDLDWSNFSGIYLFNPFGEHFLEAKERIDLATDPSWALYRQCIRAALTRLSLMPEGTRVVTYYGIGAAMPPGYALVDAEENESGMLNCYVRVDPSRTDVAPDPFEESLFDEPTEPMRVPVRKRPPA